MNSFLFSLWAYSLNSSSPKMNRITTEKLCSIVNSSGLIGKKSSSTSVRNVEKTAKNTSVSTILSNIVW